MKQFITQMFSESKDVSLMRVMVFLGFTAILGNWSLFCWKHLFTDAVIPPISWEAMISLIGFLGMKWGQRYTELLTKKTVTVKSKKESG